MSETQHGTVFSVSPALEVVLLRERVKQLEAELKQLCSVSLADECEAWKQSLAGARAEERELARPLFEAVKKAMDEEYELSERTCDILWEAWCAYGLAIRESECAS